MRMKILRINIPKETKDLYFESCNSDEEIKDDTNRGKDMTMFLLGGINNIAKLTLIPRTIYVFNTIPRKLLMVFLRELEQKIFEICMEI